MDDDEFVLDEWPSEPPQPTDLRPPAVTSQLPVRKCIYCDAEIDQQADEDFPYVTHISNCDAGDSAIHVRTSNQFHIVVPEKTGYIWTHQVGGFACRDVSIQGTLIPIGNVTELHFDQDTPDVDDEAFDAFDDPEEAKRLYLNGLRRSVDYEYGGIDLGSKLVAEVLDGVYTDDESVREETLATRDERVQAVWERIDDELPFTYERVVAPYGRPVTQEGLRWVNVTGHQYDDDVMLQDAWVDALIERDDPVALYYPNSD